ncbi:MAG: YlbF family regulator [Ruminococcaceae bacterium]|nr:YlbF family regulator [Oscillospiraceae bacterium]
MEIIEVARKLGELLRESDEFKKYEEARNDCRADHELEAKINEFKIQKKVYDTEAAREGRDEDMLAVIKQRLDTLYEEINATEIMKKFNIAEDNFNILLNAVNMTISSYITEQPYSAEGGCTHDCSTCSGCH